MSRPWPSILEDVRQNRDLVVSGPVRSALDGIFDLAAYIEGSTLQRALSGWTSMLDLCIQPGDREPYSGPYLRIAPLQSGQVAFRYIDTTIEARQWHREVPPDAAIARLDSFLEQLRWVGVLPKA